MADEPPTQEARMFHNTEISTMVQLVTTAEAAQVMAMDDKILQAEQRSFHSFFDVHVIAKDDGSYSLFEEADYGELPTHLIDDIIYTAQGKMSDEY